MQTHRATGSGEPSVRVGLLSDTHGTLDARVSAVLRRCDWIVHAGDVGSAAVLQELRTAQRYLVAVRGNNDVRSKWSPAEHDALGALPDEATLELPGGDLVVTHGDNFPAGRRHDALRRAYASARAVLYGHSHRLCVDQASAPWILNPGAAGRVRTFGGPSCLILHAGRRRWRVQSCRFSATSKQVSRRSFLELPPSGR